MYTGVKDFITDYTAGQDKIKLSNGTTITKTTYSGKNVVFTTNDGSLTVKNGKDKKITIIDSTGNSTTKTYSTGVSARTADLFYDNNFISDDAQISDITEQKFAVTQIQTVNSETLTSAQNFLTFAKDK